jgi:hypothetical protein
VQGLGAMLLQYAVHYVVIKFSSQVISQLAKVNKPAFDLSD